MEDFERELKVGFLDEAAQSVADVEQCFLSLETDPNNSDNLNKIFRLAHNLKGSSKAVGFDQFGAFTHEFETFILKVKNGELPATPPVVNLLLRANDFVSHMIEGLKNNLEAQFGTEELLNELRNFENVGEPSHQSEPIESVTENQESQEMAQPAAEQGDHNSVDGAPLEVAASIDAGVSDDTNWELLREMNEKSLVPETPPMFELPQVDPPNTQASAQPPNVPKPTPAPVASAAPVAASPVPAGQSGGAGKAVSEESIRVSLSKVETLINFVGEMVILQSVMREQLTEQSSMLMRKTVHQMGKVGKEIQDLSMGLRMVPVKSTFQKMQRIVRDTAQVLGKEVGIQLVGEETELDKTVLEKINDPLVHLVRNSVDHGIEAASLRQERGKPARGSVVLKSYHQSGKLIIEVIDDGGGLDAEKLKKKAIEKGVLKPGAQISENEAYQLIFAPGFSTKDQVSEVSGRGVGMDVVRTNIKELGGEITIQSELEKGTTFRISLPLTLAIIDAMVLRYGKEKFVMPLGHVFETLQPRKEMLQETTNMGNVLLLRGENLPLYRLGDFFNIKSTTPANQMIAMVVRTAGKPFGILVDDILGQYQVVVKQLGPELQGFVGVSGSTILGDGRPCLILEPIDLIKRKLVLHTPLHLEGKAA